MKVEERHIRWGLIVSTLLFAALMILFIVLFATKHEDSSAFLLSYNAGANSNANSLAAQVKSSLEGKKFHVNSIAVDVEGVTATALFSLRGDQSLGSVDASFSSYTNHKLTDGSVRISEVCHATFAPPITQGPVVTTKAPTTTKKPDATKYCQGDQRKKDLVIVVDLLPNAPGIDNDNKAQALNTIQTKIITGVDFSKTNIYVIGVNETGAVPVPNPSCSDANCFVTAWAHIAAYSAAETGKNTGTLKLDDVFSTIDLLDKRPNVAFEVTLYLGHMFTAPTIDIRERGAFVSVIQTTPVPIGAASIESTKTVATDSWLDAANEDALKGTFCQYYYGDTAPLTTETKLVMGNFMEQLAAAPAPDLSCQKVDVLFVFDVSQSVPEPLLAPYRVFADNLQQQFTFTGAKDNDNAEAGIITFNDTAFVNLPRGPTTQVLMSYTINHIQEFGGLTNTEAALMKVQEQLRTSNPNHGKLVIIMTDGQPNTGNTQNAITIGQTLTAQGATIFFVGTGQYEADDAKVLAQINGNKNWVYDNTSVASIEIPKQSVYLYPCPIASCEMAYFAVEVSEITHDNGFAVTALNIVQNTVDQVYKMKGNDTQFKLMLYNDQSHFLPLAKDGYSYQAISSVLHNLITNDTYLRTFLSGHTWLDKSINDLTVDIKKQQFLQRYFESVVMMLGEANFYNLDPTTNSQPQKIASLTAASSTLRNTGARIYAVDGSQSPAKYGADLWYSVTPDDHQVKNVTYANAALFNTNYYDDIKSLTCQKPPLVNCYNSFHDVAIVLDIVNNNSSLTTYLETLVDQFQTVYTSHFSLVAMGSNTPRTLVELGAYSNADFISTALKNYTLWRTGHDNQPRNRAVIDKMLTEVYGQFGCGQYSDDKDRIMAPNTVVVISDDFVNYDPNTWTAFTDDQTDKWCRDCASQPNFIFISAMDDGYNGYQVPIVPNTLQLPGTLWDLGDPDSIRNFNTIVNAICDSSLPVCASYATSMLCPV